MASIRLRGNKYHVQIRRRGLPSLTRSFLTKRDAEAWARQKEVEADRGELGPDRKALDGMTVGCLVKRYRDEVTVTKKGWEQETWRLNAFLRHPICRKKLSSITSADFASYRDDRLKLVKPKSLKTELSPIHNMFEVARDEWGLPIRENPLDKVKLKAVDNRRERRLRDGELELILEAASTRKNPYIIPVILFALETAMRRGEILALGWDDIDLKRSCVTIREAKNGYSRTIPLSPKAMNILDNTLDIQKGMSNGIWCCQKGEASGLCKGNYINLDHYKKNHSGADLAFPITANAFRLAWQRTIKLSGIQDLHFHDLRHEAISRLFEIGLTVPEVASISGHRDARMLLRYAHAQTKVVQAKLQAMR
jgi:integrase